MPKKLRNAPGGVIYHVLNRAVARIKIFRTDKDYAAFENAMAEAVERERMRLLAYVVMPNHWHLVVYPEHNGQLSGFMHWLTLAHASRWRTAHQTVGYGPLYQGRFKSFPVQGGGYLSTVLRYVERNPLRAGLVKRAEEWRWSSLYRREQGDDAAKSMLADWPTPRRDDWIEWTNRPQTAAEESAVRASVRRSRPYGDDRWGQDMCRRLGLDPCVRPVGRPRTQPATS
jgi:putative transposase